ncbi:RNA-binding (RRM/RBD/RNP motifs) family protein [Thalictrum thalictroides]|uniref:RNA-binding (RRM/RBD/RNP motifs) family protein n=1 Tax=Thalictrum thalictroides TaxID=46969 RepID=A0A7J6W7N5_THATH|nr:RNA-binding (RRM/RBD/RNP motifs) family protein [Thalictrum thalictroides]
MTRFCSSYGKIKKVVFRSRGVCDIHYNVAEWPVIVDILNSLNGQVVDEHQLIAQPASVIPVEILKHLWSQPDGRRHLSTLIQKLCQNIEKAL